MTADEGVKIVVVVMAFLAGLYFGALLTLWFVGMLTGPRGAVIAEIGLLLGFVFAAIWAGKKWAPR